MAMTYLDTATHTLSLGVEHAIAITHDGAGNYSLNVDGVLVGSLSVPVRTFRVAGMTDFMGGIADGIPAEERGEAGSPYSGDGTTDLFAVMDVRFDRVWQRALTVVELGVEAASDVPVDTDDLVSSVGLTALGDYEDAIGDHDFTSVDPYFDSNPESSGDGRLRFSKWSDNIRRPIGWLSLDQPFTALWRLRLTTFAPNPDDIYDFRFFTQSTNWTTVPYIWFGNLAGANQVYMEIGYNQVTLTDGPKGPHCADEEKSVTNSTGPVLKPVRGAIAFSCAGGGVPPVAVDISDSETWL